jgi:hypothetical protein
VRSDYRVESDIDGIPGTHTGLSVGESSVRVFLHLLWHLLTPMLGLPFAYLSDRLGWSPEIGETLKLLSLMGIAVVVGTFALGRFLRSTRDKPGVRKKAVAEFLGVPDEREPEPSRRLWQWQCVL